MTATARPDPYRKVRETYERRCDVRFTDAQWYSIQEDAQSGSAAPHPSAYVRSLHETTERMARFLSLGTRRPQSSRKPRIVEGKPRGPYAGPLLDRIDFVRHVDACRMMARQAGIGRTFWRAFAEAHWKQTGIHADPQVLERRYRSAKKQLSKVPLALHGWKNASEKLRFLGVTKVEALTEGQTRASQVKVFHLPTEWHGKLKALRDAERADRRAVPLANRGRVKAARQRR